MKVIFIILTIIPAFSLAQEAHIELGEQINSHYDEQAPVLHPDNSTLYFKRSKHPENTGGVTDKGDIWISELKNGNWSKPYKAASELNHDYFNSVLGFGGAGDKIYLHGHYNKNGRRPRSKGISVSKKVAEGWSFPEKLDIPYFTNRSDHQSGCINHEENVMILALETYQTEGREDLYVSFKKEDGWTEPENLGATINTSLQELTPFLLADGETLVFASNGHDGFGSRDLFVSRRLDSTWKNWSEPQNLGSSINTKGREMYFFVPEGSDFAYFTSTQNSDGHSDIKKFRLPDSLKMSPEPQQPVAQQKEEDSDTLANTDEQPKENLTNEEPSPKADTLDLVKNEKAEEVAEQQMEARQEPEEADTALLMADTTNKRMNMDSVSGLDSSQIEVGTKVALSDVNFQRGVAVMLPGSEASLDKVVNFLKKQPNVKIEVAGHTEPRGDADLNMQLSEKRAERVQKYIVDQGIDPERVVAKGYGGNQPIADNTQESGRIKNRRVEFIILEK